MTPRERWLRTLNHEKADRVPADYRATPEATRKLMDHLGLQTMQQLSERLHFDMILDVGPKWIGPKLEPGYDEYGIGYQDTDYGIGHYHDAVYHPLAKYNSVEEIKAEYEWPSLDWWSYDHIPAAIEGKEDWVIRGGWSEPYATYKWMRGVAQGYMDLVENPEMVHYVLGRLYEDCYQKAARVYEQIPGMVIWTWVAEDVGSQNGLIISLEHIKEFFVPHMKRMVDLVHSAGAYAFHHSDGAVRENVPQMIEVGMDVLDPIQWRCAGMEREALKRDFGDALVFHGGMDNQQTMAFGSVDAVRQEVIDNTRILGEGGGYILGPCHNLQAISPPENIVTMYDTAYEVGFY